MRTIMTYSEKERKSDEFKEYTTPIDLDKLEKLGYEIKQMTEQENNPLEFYKSELIKKIEKLRYLEVALSPERLQSKKMYNYALEKVIQLIKEQ